MTQLVGKPVSFYEADITDKASLRTVFTKEKIDCVLHIAALKSVSESCDSPLKYYSVNMAGSIHLMEIMEEFGVKKIVFSSSSTVFGVPEYLPIDENHPTGKCINPYGRTKYFFEEMLRDLAHSKKVLLTGFERPFQKLFFDARRSKALELRFLLQNDEYYIKVKFPCTYIKAKLSCCTSWNLYLVGIGIGPFKFSRA